MVMCAVVAACSGSSQSAPRPAEPAEPEPARVERTELGSANATPAASPASAPGPGAKLTPVGERAQVLREAADLLDKAQGALDSGNRNLADQLFSTAELLTGPEAVAPVAARFREGAPPRITTPTLKVDPSAAPQPFGLITLEPESGKWKPRTPKRLVVEQRNREFLPHVMAISVGSTVSFPNFDTVFHNVFSTSPAGPFDLGIYKVGEAREFTFPKEGIVRLGCNLHANMSGFIAVVAAPAYVVTDDTGRFAFRRLPPGKYRLKAWSERSKAPVTQDITIKAGRNTVTVDVAGDATPGPQPDKFGGKRG
jgi:plastocyanin